MLDLLEDLMQAPGIARLEASLLHNCCQHDEFVHVAMDATLRTMLRVKGQAPFNAAKDIRQQAAIGDNTAHTTTPPMRGPIGVAPSIGSLCEQLVAPMIIDMW